MIENADYWIGALMGAVVFLWPMWAMSKFDRVTQKELVKISKKYAGINSAYFIHIILTLLIIILVVLGLPSVIGQELKLLQKRPIMMAWSTLPFSGFALSQGLFALRKGVYPTSKFYGQATTYAYTKDDRIQKFGRKQIIAALAVTSLSFLIGFVRWRGGF